MTKPLMDFRFDSRRTDESTLSFDCRTERVNIVGNTAFVLSSGQIDRQETWIERVSKTIKGRMRSGVDKGRLKSVLRPNNGAELELEIFPSQSSSPLYKPTSTEH